MIETDLNGRRSILLSRRCDARNFRGVNPSGKHTAGKILLPSEKILEEHRTLTVGLGLPAPFEGITAIELFYLVRGKYYGKMHGIGRKPRVQ